MSVRHPHATIPGPIQHEEWDKRRAFAREMIRFYESRLDLVARSEKRLPEDNIVLQKDEPAAIDRQECAAAAAAAQAAQRPPEPPKASEPKKKKAKKRKAKPKPPPRPIPRWVREGRPNNRKLLDSSHVQRMSAPSIRRR